MCFGEPVEKARQGAAIRETWSPGTQDGSPLINSMGAFTIFRPSKITDEEVGTIIYSS
jgi:hypothetical protein